MMIDLQAAKRHFGSAILALGLVLALAAPATAAAPLSWSAGVVKNAAGFVGVACPAKTLCVAFGRSRVFVSEHPAAGASSFRQVRGLHIPANLLSMESTEIYDFACPSTHLCLTATEGKLIYTTNPSGGASAWHTITLDNQPLDLIGAITCRSVHFCVAIDDVPPTSGPSNGTGKVFVSTNPSGGLSAWKKGATVVDDYIQGLSCPSQSVCLAGGQDGVDWTTDVTDPLGTWEFQQGGEEGAVDAVSCPSITLCLAVPDLTAQGNNDIVTAHPTSGKWRKTPIGSGYLTCASMTLCVAAAYPGQSVWATTRPTAGKKEWFYTRIKRGEDFLRSVSCASNSFCVAAGDGGALDVGQAP
jgi:hypothetical protein